MEEEKQEKQKKSSSKIFGIIIIVLLVIIAVLGCIAGIQMKNKENEENGGNLKSKIENLKLDKEITIGRLTYYIENDWKTDETILGDNTFEFYYPEKDIELDVAIESNKYSNDIDKNVNDFIAVIKESDNNEFISKNKKTIQNYNYGIVEDYVRVSSDKSQRISYILPNDDECYRISIIQKGKIDSDYIELLEKFISKIKIERFYDVITDYDGIYKFSLKNNSSDIAIGLLSFNNGECKIKSLNYNFNNIDKQDIYTYEGICGQGKKEKSDNFCFTIFKESNNSSYYCTYKFVNKDENSLSFKLDDGFDLTRHVTIEELNLVFVGKSEINLENEFEQFSESEKNRINEEEKARIEREEAEKKAQQEQEKNNFIASCQTYTFEQMARNPENFKGTNVKVTGEVIQVLYGTNRVDLRVNITKQGTYSTWYTDTIYVTYNTSAGEDKILEDDIITIFGTSLGDYTYTSTLGASITLPYISAKYIEVN